MLCLHLYTLRNESHVVQRAHLNLIVQVYFQVQMLFVTSVATWWFLVLRRRYSFGIFSCVHHLTLAVIEELNP